MDNDANLVPVSYDEYRVAVDYCLYRAGYTCETESVDAVELSTHWADSLDPRVIAKQLLDSEALVPPHQSLSSTGQVHDAPLTLEIYGTLAHGHLMQFGVGYDNIDEHLRPAWKIGTPAYEAACDLMAVQENKPS